MEHIQASLVRIRYNTESDGKVLVWRMVIDGKERLVNNIRIEKPCFTSSDWMEELGCYKHHISIQDCIISINADTQEAIVTEAHPM